MLSGDYFSEFFLNYDYIGAPWPHHQDFNVGNGGFSMRSAKLIHAVQHFFLPDDLNSAEDVVICRYLRARLEDKIALKFASKSVAEKFSFEMAQVSHQTFGFHGLFNLPSIMQQDLQILFDNLQPKTAIRFFRAFRDACEALPPPGRELFIITVKGIQMNLQQPRLLQIDVQPNFIFTRIWLLYCGLRMQ